MLRTLSLDLGSKTGYVLAEDAKVVRSGVRDFALKSHEHKGQRGIKFYNFLVSFGQVDEVYYEVIQFSGMRKGGAAWQGDNGELYKGLLMLLNMYCCGWNIDPIGMHPGTLKKEFAGHGHATKEDMCRAAHRIGWQGGADGQVIHNDEADAIGLQAANLRLRHGLQLTF